MARNLRKSIRTFVALATAATAFSGAMAGVIGTSGTAGADTADLGVHCAPPVGSWSGITAIGSIAPSPVVAGQSFSVSGLSLSMLMDPVLVLIFPGNTVTGTYATSLAVTGASPSTVPVTFAFGPSSITTGVVMTGTTSPVTLTANPGATSVSVAMTTTAILNATIGGGIGSTGALDCTQNALTIASASVAAGPPAVSSVLPNAGVPHGGTSVTITGSGFTGATAVHFGSTPVSTFSVNSDSSITVTSPAAGTGAVDVTVTTAAGTSPTGAADSFTYTNGPIVTGVSPNHGSPIGGTVVTLSGVNFTGATAVDFGSTPAASFSSTSDTSLTATSPPGTGVVNVTVRSANGLSILSSQDQFSYQSGYRLVTASGGVYNYGGAGFFGAVTGPLNKPMVGMAATPDNNGYWLVAGDGGVFSYGDAAFYGSTGNATLNKPVVGMAATPDGKGYWLVAADGGIFAFGDAAYYGSTGNITLNKPVVGMAATHDGKGYWLVAGDGGVFSYGDAAFYGSTGNITLNKPVVGMAATPDGKGYWFVASDGGIFSYGDASFLGSMGATPLNAPIVGMAAALGGYYLLGQDGGLFAYNVPYAGTPTAPSPFVGMSA